MTFAVNVQGGTGAGSKRPLKEIRWTHDCDSTQPRATETADEWAKRMTVDSRTFAPTSTRRTLTAYSCPACGTRRPNPFPTSGGTKPVTVLR